MAVSKRLRFEVLRRDNYTCRYCGRKAPEAPLTVDHVMPVALGGGDIPENLVTACVDCNSGKSSSSPDSNIVQAVSDDAVRLAEATRKATEAREAEILDIIEWVECAWTARWLRDADANDTTTRYRHPGRYYAPRPQNWEQTVRALATRGFDFKFLTGAVATSLRHSDHVAWADKWRYFCGICWRELDARREAGFREYEGADA